MPKPKDTPEPTKVDNSETPPAAPESRRLDPAVDVQAILARLEALEASKAALEAENAALKAAPPVASKESARDAVARQLVDTAFSNSPYANVAKNINPDDFKNPPRSEVDNTGEMPMTVDGKVTMVPFKNKIRSF